MLFDEDNYWFNRTLDYQYDVEDFTDGIIEAKKADKIQKKIAAYTKAVNLYHGAFLPEAEGSWVWAERQRLREMYLEGTLELARFEFEKGDYASALDNCQRILNEDPCLEEAHRLAMLVYAARGNRAGVNRQFERCRLALEREVNVAPSPQTIALFESLSR